MGKIFTPGIVVAIGNQKGGVGKSVLTSLVANYLHKNYNDKLKIVVVDSDDMQSSLYTKRQEEITDLSEKELNQLYRLVQISSADIPGQIEILQDEYDIIFIDLPGNLKQPGVITAYHLVDILIAPSQASEFDISSTIKFINLYKEVISEREKNHLRTAIYGIFSRVDPQNKDFKLLYANKESLPIPFLENYVPESKVTFQRNVTTISAYENNRYSDYTDLCEEIIECITKFYNHESK